MFALIDIPFYDNDLLKLAFRFLHDVLFLGLVIRFAWQPNGRDREFAFTAMMLNITVFFICFAMKKLELGLGMALGLFAIFGVLRYRTESIRTKDLTYLFIVVGLAVINALSNRKTSYLELLAVNSLIVGASLFGERLVNGAKASKVTVDPAEPLKRKKQSVDYDRLDLLAPERRDDLLADLCQRTYQPVSHVRVDSIDLARGTASLSIWVTEKNGH
ncbi:MAG: DUF4956 domain-containing protein [Verrucomicrobiota bacterium JB023]|nr:DUF4956 domain-containing protein [Verrucomicrobiota bacterium JB023]